MKRARARWRGLQRRATAAAVVAVGALTLSAHVGSPDAVWEGTAGPYAARVVIRDPGVIPGQAEIVVRTAAHGVRSVGVTAAIWNGGTGAAPPPDAAVRVPGDSTLWSARLWFMAASAYAVRVTITGDVGAGTAVVPFVALASRTLPLSLPLRVVLVLLGVLLIAGMVTIVASATRESTVPPDSDVDPARRRTGRVAGAVAGIVVLGLLWFGNAWWNGAARAYAASISNGQGFPVDATITADKGQRILHIAITDSLWMSLHNGRAVGPDEQNVPPLIPDHGKLMHAFLVSETGDGFAHLHPLSVDSAHFNSDLPPLPPGRYRFYADIVHESAWGQTLTTTVTIDSSVAKWQPTDNDDAWTVAAATTDTVTDVGDKLRVVWHRGSAALRRGADAQFNFQVLNADGTPARIQLYLGMAGHLVLVRDDGAVYIHLHPMGTASMAAIDAATMRRPGDSVLGRLGQRLTATGMISQADEATTVPGILSFPYQFAAAGHYRLWMQFRSNGVVHTGAFRFDVADSTGARTK
jgi:hypothetical protein